MKNVFIQGSTHKPMREVTQHMDADGTSFCEITLGVNDILVALDDVLSDVDEVSEADFQKLVDVAHDILAVELLRDADRQSHMAHQLRFFRFYKRKLASLLPFI